MAEKKIQKINTLKPASIILCVTNGIKQQEMLLEKDNLNLAQFDFKKIEKDTRFAISLMLKGLTVQND